MAEQVNLMLKNVDMTFYDLNEPSAFKEGDPKKYKARIYVDPESKSASVLMGAIESFHKGIMAPYSLKKAMSQQSSQIKRIGNEIDEDSNATDKFEVANWAGHYKLSGTSQFKINVFTNHGERLPIPSPILERTHGEKTSVINGDVIFNVSHCPDGINLKFTLYLNAIKINQIREIDTPEFDISEITSVSHASLFGFPTQGKFIEEKEAPKEAISNTSRMVELIAIGGFLCRIQIILHLHLADG